MNQSITSKPSPELIAQINALHTECVDSAMTAIVKAMDAGDKLAQAKELVGHGEWQKWIAANFKGSQQTARRYLRVAEHRGEIETRLKEGALTSLTDAIWVISEAGGKYLDGSKRSRVSVLATEGEHGDDETQTPFGYNENEIDLFREKFAEAIRERTIDRSDHNFEMQCEGFCNSARTQGISVLAVLDAARLKHKQPKLHAQVLAGTISLSEGLMMAQLEVLNTIGA